MKAFILAIMMFASTLFGAEMTNGGYYSDSPAQCVLVTQAGPVATNAIVAGKTYQVGDAISEIITTNATSFYFAGVQLMHVGVDSEFSITLFDQVVENLDAMPQKAQFGAHTLNLSLNRGEFALIYPNKDANSRINVNTHYADYELSGGKYYFKVSGKSTLVYVLEGGMVVHGDKSKVDVVEKGNLAIAVPFADPSSGLDDKIITSFKKAKQEENERFAAPILTIEKKWANVDFFIIDGKVVGVRLK